MSEIVVSSYQEWDDIYYSASSLDKPFVTLFTAPAWCIPCRALEPHWKKAVECLDNYTVVKVDLGAAREDVATHWATEMFGIRGVPTIYKWDADGNRSEVKGRTVVQLISELKES